MGGESTHRRRYFLRLQALRIEPFMLLPVVESTVMNTIGNYLLWLAAYLRLVICDLDRLGLSLRWGLLRVEPKIKTAFPLLESVP